ncbi:hypothetical protein ACOZE3_30750, partial [Streptomyces cinereoruber]|uniref:hypothetical protein n=1 Tax=Streptomyces cinereoruber TaxID=67260 RepID=UPI003BF496E1
SNSSTVSASVTFSLVIGASSMIGSYTERFTVPRLVDPLLGHLAQALERREQSRLASSPPIRLRASIHVGPLETADHRGDAANDACRFVDSGAVRRAMDAAIGHNLLLAAVVSDPVFNRTVRANRTKTLHPQHFQPATALVEGKPGFEETCWLHVPGLVPAVIAPYLIPDNNASPTGPPSPGVRDKTQDSTTHKEPDLAGRQTVKAKGKARVVQVGRDYNRGREEA